MKIFKQIKIELKNIIIITKNEAVLWFGENFDNFCEFTHWFKFRFSQGNP